MHFDLRQLALQRRPKRTRNVVLAAILTTKAQKDDLASIYLRALEPWTRAVEMLAPVYERELERKLQTDSVEDLGASNDAIAAAIDRLVLQLTPQLREWAFRVEQWHRGKWARAILAGLEVDLETVLGPEDVREEIGAFLQRNTSLIRNINEQARARIADSIWRGFQQRSTVAEISKEIRETTGMARKRARRVAADQTVKLASALDRERQRQAGIDHWKWRHSGKLHPRVKHLERDGNIYSDKTAPEDGPGELPYCGCVRQAVLIFEDN